MPSTIRSAGFPRLQSPDPKEARRWIEEYGAKPQTLLLPTTFDVPIAPLTSRDRQTPAGQRYGIGGARRGAKILGFISALVVLLGISAEIASILTAVSGGAQASKLNWPMAHVPVHWGFCQYLPNSDAPSATYGVGLSIFFHSINTVLLVGLLSFLARFVREPIADYGIGVTGFLMFWLGVNIAAKWLGTVQFVAGISLMVFGLLNLIFGWHYFVLAFRLALTPPIQKKLDMSEHEARMKAFNEQKKQRENRRRVPDEVRQLDPDARPLYTGSADLIHKQLEAYEQVMQPPTEAESSK